MKLKKILLLLTVVSPVFSRNFGSWEDNDDNVPELKWLFDIEQEKSNGAENEKYTVCDTKPCRIIAEDFEQAMNKSVDPCDDFYEYVCGNWKIHNPMPPYATDWGRFQKFQHMVYSRIKGILETPPETTDILPVRQAKKWYQSCMDTEALDKRGLMPLESILIQVGGWPMIMDDEEWNKDEHTWQSIEEHYFHITGEYIFYEVTPRYSGEGISLGAGSLPLNYVIDSKYRNYTGNSYDGYVKLIKEIVKIFVLEHKADVSEKMIDKDVRDLIEFEKKLYLLNQESFDSDLTTIDGFVKMYNANITEIEDEDKKIEKIDFRRMIRKVFDMVNNDIEDSEELYVSDNVEYWIKITEILNETPKRTIVNYMHWHFMSVMIQYTTGSMRDLIWQHRRDDYGVTEPEPRWLGCVHEMKMSAAGAYAFTEKYFHGHTETDVKEMIDHIRDEMKSQIQKTTWMDEDTKKLALNKLKAMKVFLGYPDWYKNKTAVLNSYKGLHIGSDHFGNILTYERYQIKRRLRKDLQELSTVDPTVVNAFYDPFGNAIELPAADFQPPLFTTQLPRNINYGVAGVVIGHEIGHGFDSSGIKLGEDGNDTKIAKHIMDMYYQRAECFLDQFNEYVGVTEADYDDTTPGYMDSSFGRRTWGENIADSTGLHSVFEAYRKMMKESSKSDNRLPGFEQYTDHQMFFISFGALWCQDIRPKLAEQLERWDSHSPARLRVMGAISNTNDFARAFDCPKGSRMNPSNKCNIWKASKTKSNAEDDSPSHRSKNHKCYMNW